jgi:N-acetyl-beta-hexosaminidase
MKTLIDWLAFFKVNCIGFELMDRYEFPRRPVIGAPGAYTKAEMQDLTRYALSRHIQLVPVVQSPAHMRYVLKHPEFAHLRADGNNYQACMCNEEAMQLFLDMHQDMIDATPGVDLFFLSTDEV